MKSIKLNRKNTADSFGFEWQIHLDGKIEKKRIFGRTKEKDREYFFQAARLRPQDIKGKTILDAGCGSGKLTYEISKYKPKVIYGIDIHSAIGLVQRKYEDIKNLKIIKADILNLPFKQNTFDIVWCNGVIHHTANPYLAFQKLVKVVKPGGTLYIWVYEKRFSPYKFTKDIFRLTRLDRLPYPLIFKICQLFAFISVLIHSVYKLIAGLFYPFFRKSKYFLKTIRDRSYKEFLMTWFDALSPKYDFRFTKKEVTKWFKDNGFKDLKYYWDQAGICGIKK